MTNLALVLATAVVCAPANPRITPAALKQAAWRIPPQSILIAPNRPSDAELDKKQAKKRKQRVDK